jgi:RNA polymerase sigma factor (sigma-70 family)
MSGNEWLAEQFEASRAHLRAVAYRMLGSAGEADDAVQECWLRVSRADSSAVENLEGWLTTALARICLNVLRSRKSQREEPLRESAGQPVVANGKRSDPEDEALFAESVGLALLVILERLTPGERVAFVLHDAFGMASLANNSSAQKLLCCNAFISVMKATELWNCDNLSNLQRLSRRRTLFTEA